MCELLLMVKHRDVFTDMGPQKGDVVHVAPDGWKWGSAELEQVHFRILKLPNVAFGDALHLAHPQPHPGSHAVFRKEPGHRTHWRMHTFHLDHPSLSPAWRAHLADDARGGGGHHTEHSIRSVADLHSIKPPLTDGTV